VLPPPELLVTAAHEKFDANLRLSHERTREVLADLLARFDRWINREQVAAEADRRLAGQRA
jgi:hypothetical protein